TLPSIAPGQTGVVALPWRDSLPGTAGPTHAPAPNGRPLWHVNVDVRLAADTPWAPAGHAVSFEQFDVTAATATRGQAAAGPAARAAAVARAGEVEWPAGLSVSDDGLLVGSGDAPIIRGGIGNFFRATTGIDRGTGGESYANDWYRAGLDRLERKVVSMTTGERVVVDAVYQVDGHTRFEQRSVYEPVGPDAIGVEETVVCDPALPVLPRIGVVYEVDPSLSRVEWLGRGPHESYCDRTLSARVGRYAGTVDDQHYPFILPVECGGKEDVRWIALVDGTGRGVAFSSDIAFHASALRHSVAEYEAAQHGWDLATSDRIHVNLDHRHLGLGGDVGWYKCIDEEYLIHPGTYRYRYIVRLVG
ncbi:MAG: hypothetical protein EA382_18450, partial [Spirochaetaceae bacterium]